MSPEDRFLRSLLSNPGDIPSRLVYSDWLEERDAQRAEYLRITTDLLCSNQDKAHTARLKNRLDELRETIPLDWLAFIDTLGQPFGGADLGGTLFFCEPPELPFTEVISTRGDLVTFESQFRDAQRFGPGLLKDLEMLCGLTIECCFYGAADCPIYPFVCELGPQLNALTGEDVLKALKARDFKSRYIKDLKATDIPYPGKHSNDGLSIENDEVHNDVSKQFIFPREEASEDTPVETLAPYLESYQKLEHAVEGHLWYVLLHQRPKQRGEYLFSDYVMLFAVGRSKEGDRLIGIVTCQVCHNLCD